MTERNKIESVLKKFKLEEMSIDNPINKLLDSLEAIRFTLEMERATGMEIKISHDLTIRDIYEKIV